MKKTHKNQNGFTPIEALLAVLIVAVIGLAGYYVYHARRSTGSRPSTTTSTAAPTKSAAGTPRLVYLGSQGVTIASSADVSKLTDAGSNLKNFFGKNVGRQIGTPGGDMEPQTFSVYSLYGDYAVGSSNAYDATVIWGPKVTGLVSPYPDDVSGGNVAAIAQTQDAWGCSDLAAAHVPVQLLPDPTNPSDECLDASGSLVPYKG